MQPVLPMVYLHNKAISEIKVGQEEKSCFYTGKTPC